MSKDLETVKEPDRYLREELPRKRDKPVWREGLD